MERKISKRLRWFMEMNLEEPKGLLKDILAAKRKIIISLPSTKQVDKRVWQALMRTNAQITVYSDGTKVPLKNVKLQRQNKAFRLS